LPNSKVLLSLRGVSKKFPGVQALDKIDIDIFKREIHALVGENGAGKSTLISVLGGIVRPDEGQIILESEEVRINNPQIAKSYGISVVHQDLSLILNLTVAENIFLGIELTKGGWVQSSKIVNGTKELLNRMEASISPNSFVSELDTSKRQVVEICKAIVTNPKIIALDEPTGSLTEHQIRDLFKIILKMKQIGVTVIYISHHIEEVLQIADRLTILRDGKKIGTFKRSKVDKDKIVSKMVGHKIDLQFPKMEFEKGPYVLEVKNLSTKKYFKNISFSLRKGEILGIGGLIGCYREQLGEALFGLVPIDNGEIFIKGRRVSINNPFESIKNGIGYVPADRNIRGLILSLPVDDNITLTIIRDLIIGGIFFNFKRQSLMVKRFINSLKIKVKSLKEIVLNLSGGNKQKVLLAKWLAFNNLSILILNEPTHGIDVATKAEIHKRISELAKEGLSIILITSELSELMGMSDRIIVMNKGIIVKEFMRQEFNKEIIMTEATM